MAKKWPSMRPKFKVGGAPRPAKHVRAPFGKAPPELAKAVEEAKKAIRTSIKIPKIRKKK